jgi:hypothetical protein
MDLRTSTGSIRNTSCPTKRADLTRKFQNNKKVHEEVSSGYIEGQTRYRQARFDLGLRYEKTKTESLVADVRTDREVTAAGYSLTSVDGIRYKWRDGKQNTRRGSYDDWFLSGRHEIRLHPESSSARLPSANPSSVPITATSAASRRSTTPPWSLRCRIQNCSPEHSTKYLCRACSISSSLRASLACLSINSR